MFSVLGELGLAFLIVTYLIFILMLFPEILHSDIPTGDSIYDRKIRRNLIKQYYINWLNCHPAGKLFNCNLADDIFVKYISLNETSAHASKDYYSTLAVLQLDSVLQNARLIKSVLPKNNTKNQKGFNRILIMEHFIQGIGRIRLTVGVKNVDGSKVQYCITTLRPSQNN